MLKEKWQKLKDKPKFTRLQKFCREKFSYVDFIFALIIIEFFYLFWNQYKIIWSANKESLFLASPFLLIFAWLVWRDRRRSKLLSREVLLSAAGVFLAAWIFIFQTTDNNVSQTDLITTTNTYNCATASSALTISPTNGLLLTPFIIEPYLNNPDVIFRMYGNPYGLKVLGAVLTMESANNLINLVDSLGVQITNQNQSSYAGQLILKYNSQLIQSAYEIGNVICVPLPPQESWFKKTLSQISHLNKIK